MRAYYHTHLGEPTHTTEAVDAVLTGHDARLVVQDDRVMVESPLQSDRGVALQAALVEAGLWPLAQPPEARVRRVRAAAMQQIEEGKAQRAVNSKRLRAMRAKGEAQWRKETGHPHWEWEQMLSDYEAGEAEANRQVEDGYRALEAVRGAVNPSTIEAIEGDWGLR